MDTHSLPELIAAARSGKPDAVDRLFLAAHAELRSLAHRRLRRSPSITALETTALVHECYLRLAKLSQFGSNDMSFLLAYAARAMRSIIIDILRERDSLRRGAAAVHVTFDPESHAVDSDEADVLRINEALEELQGLEPRLASVVEMKYFAGLNFAEIAAALDLTERTVRRDWQKARLLLYNELKEP